MASAGHAQTRHYLSDEEAIGRAMQGADTVCVDTLRLSQVDRESLGSDLGGVVVDSVYAFHRAMVGDNVLTRAVVVNSLGQYEPITFVVALGGDGTVRSVEIMVYRESRGGEVRRRAFLEQFEGTGPDDGLRAGDDIQNITGATISSRAVTNGVRLALRLQKMLWSRKN
jgi:hypothetical protein